MVKKTVGSDEHLQMFAVTIITIQEGSRFSLHYDVIFTISFFIIWWFFGPDKTTLLYCVQTTVHEGSRFSSTGIK